MGKWAETLWKQYKVDNKMYEELLYVARDGVVSRKRNLDAVRDLEALTMETAAVADRVKRIRSDSSISHAFPDIPEAETWLSHFRKDALCYPILVVLGPSRAGKTEWAKSLFRCPLD